MNLAIDVERWFTLPANSGLDEDDQLRELYKLSQQLGHFLLIHISDEAKQQTFLLQQLRMVAASALHNWRNPWASIHSSGYRLLEPRPIHPDLNVLQQYSQPLLQLLSSQSTRTNMTYAIETLLALLTVAQLILLQQSAHNTAAA